MSTGYYPMNDIKFKDILDKEELLKKEYGLNIWKEEEECVSGEKYVSYFFIDEQNELYIDPGPQRTIFMRYGPNDVSNIISILQRVFNTPIIDEYSLPESYWRRLELEDK